MSLRIDSLMEVIEDLERNRATLKRNLTAIETTITTLRALYRNGVPRELPSLQPEKLEASPAAEEHDDGCEEVHPVRFNKDAEIGLNEAILKCVREGKHTSITIIDAVLQIRPSTSQRGNVSAAVSILLRSNRLHKGDDLILRPVVNGKVENLPVPKDGLSMRSSLATN